MGGGGVSLEYFKASGRNQEGKQGRKEGKKDRLKTRAPGMWVCQTMLKHLLSPAYRTGL